MIYLGRHKTMKYYFYDADTSIFYCFSNKQDGYHIAYVSHNDGWFMTSYTTLLPEYDDNDEYIYPEICDVPYLKNVILKKILNSIL
jgi:hypothetical protein